MDILSTLTQIKYSFLGLGGFFYLKLFFIPKVRHRWCELVVKHKYEPGYGDVERFLREDQVNYI